MSESDPTERVRRLIDKLWNQGDTDCIDEMYGPSTKIVMPGSTYHDRDGVREMIATYREAFPDLEITIDDIFGSDTAAATRWTFSGTHQGPFMALEATGRQISLRGVTLTRFKDDLVAEARYFWDRLQQLNQLGISPEDVI